MKRTLAVFYNNFRLVFLLHRRNDVIDNWGKRCSWLKQMGNTPIGQAKFSARHFQVTHKSIRVIR